MSRVRVKNNGVIGTRIGETAGILPITKRGRDNGSIIGEEKLFSNLDNAVNKMGGIWNLGGIVPKSHGITTQYQEWYWVYPSPYQVSVTLGPGDAISGTWNPHGDTCPDPFWGGAGSPNGDGNWGVSQWNWVNIGTCPWTWQGIIGWGYYTSSYWVYPSPYQTWRWAYSTTYYTVWDYF